MNSTAAKAIDSNKEWLKQIIEWMRFTRENKRFYEFFMQMPEQRSEMTFLLHGAPLLVRSSRTWPTNFGSENWLNECLTRYLNLYLSRVQLWFDNYMAVTCVSKRAIIEYLGHFFCLLLLFCSCDCARESNFKSHRMALERQVCDYFLPFRRSRRRL